MAEIIQNGYKINFTASTQDLDNNNYYTEIYLNITSVDNTNNSNLYLELSESGTGIPLGRYIENYVGTLISLPFNQTIQFNGALNEFTAEIPIQSENHMYIDMKLVSDINGGTTIYSDSIESGTVKGYTFTKAQIDKPRVINNMLVINGYVKNGINNPASWHINLENGYYWDAQMPEYSEPLEEFWNIPGYKCELDNNGNIIFNLPIKQNLYIETIELEYCGQWEIDSEWKSGGVYNSIDCRRTPVPQKYNPFVGNNENNKPSRYRAYINGKYYQFIINK